LDGFHGLTGVSVTQVENGAVTYKNADGVEQSIPYDSLFVAAGMKPLRQEALAFYGSADDFYLIGDCQKPASVQQAMRSAFAVAHQI
jgi:NADH dehydrogenase FAD-containing subunit